jgi:glycine cleavage system H protein
MEGFSYSDIFETKGIEYIAIIAFFMVLIPFWFILNKHGVIQQKIRKALKVLSFDNLKIPQGIFHGKNHIWAFLEKSGTASIGLDDFLLHTTGGGELRNLKKSGEIINRGELLAELVRENKTLKIFSPVSGIFVDTNSQLNENPSLLNEDPYGKGWICRIKPTKWKDEVSSLYLAEETNSWSKLELQRFKDFLAMSMKRYSPNTELAILQDGGELVDQTLSELPETIWRDFQEKFLNL